MTDYAMFRRSTPYGIVLFILYVDDMIITGSCPVVITPLKWYLQSEFKMKVLGFLCYFLGIEVAYSSRSYLLSRQKYIVDLLDCATLSDPAVFVSPPIFIPMELHLKLRRDDGTPLPQSTWYREPVGSLIYLSATRSNISQVVHVLISLLVLPPQLIMRHYFV